MSVDALQGIAIAFLGIALIIHMLTDRLSR